MARAFAKVHLLWPMTLELQYVPSATVQGVYSARTFHVGLIRPFVLRLRGAGGSMKRHVLLRSILVMLFLATELFAQEWV